MNPRKSYLGAFAGLLLLLLALPVRPEPASPPPPPEHPKHPSPLLPPWVEAPRNAFVEEAKLKIVGVGWARIRNPVFAREVAIACASGQILEAILEAIPDLCAASGDAQPHADARKRLIGDALKPKVEQLVAFKSDDGRIFVAAAITRVDASNALKALSVDAQMNPHQVFVQSLAMATEGLLKDIRPAPHPESPATDKQSELAIPDWVVDPRAAKPELKGQVICGLGASRPDKKMAMKMAEAAAQEDIAEQIKTLDGNDDSHTGGVTLVGVMAQDIWKSPEGTVFVLSLLTRDTIEATIKSESEKPEPARQRGLLDTMKRAQQLLDLRRQAK